MIYATFRRDPYDPGDFFMEGAPPHWQSMPVSIGGTFHDMLDHRRGEDFGSFANELQAIGARTYLLYYDKWSTGEGTAVSDLRRFCRDNNWVIPDPPRLTSPMKDPRLEQWMRRVEARVFSSIGADWTHQENFIHHIRIGYRWARKRYAKVSRANLYFLLGQGLPRRVRLLGSQELPDRWRIGLCLTSGKTAYEDLTV